MDFDSPAAAQKAVNALKSNGVQAQMAKVSVHLLDYLSFLLSRSPVTLSFFLLLSDVVCVYTSLLMDV